MKHYFGDFTGLPIPCTLPASMTLCEELHLVGFGCPREDECHFDDDGICILAQLGGSTMHPSDSKTLEEIEKRLEEWNIVYTDYRPFKKERCDDVLMEDAEPDVIRLIAKVKEQDREIKELQLGKEAAERLNKMNVKVADGETDRAEKAEACITEQDWEIERHLDRSVQLMAEKHYQRRHRKWALKQCRIWQRFFCFYKDDAVRFHSDRADKAEARIKGLEKWLRQSEHHNDLLAKKIRRLEAEKEKV